MYSSFWGTYVYTAKTNWRDSAWLQEVYFGIEDYLHKATVEAAAQFILQPQYTDNPQNICNGIANL